MKKETAVLYVHGKGGVASESEHYIPLFPDADVISFDYKSEKPWECFNEFKQEVKELFSLYKHVILVANSIGAYFSLLSLTEYPIKKHS